MKNFIVPIDFSEESKNGLEMAVLFSQKKEINIQMVYVISSVSDYHPSTISEEHKFAEKRFEKLLAEYQPRLGNNSKIRHIIKQGKVYKEIIGQVNSYKDAIVSASTHGASGFEELFAGSNALKIMAATHSPVLTIRESPAPKKIRKIILPIKLLADTRQKLPIAADLADLFGAEIHVLGISVSNSKRDIDRIESYARQSIGYLKSRRVPHVHQLVTGDSLPTLTLNYAQAVGGDLIVMMSSAIDKWNVFFGSYAQQMLNRSRLPILSIKPKPRQLPSGFNTFG
jgi:nucleotide-binding universal stress UspA family protein